MLNAMELISPNITERKRGAAWITKKLIKQPSKKASHVLTSSNA